MQVEVLRLWSDGKLIPRWQWAKLKPIRGILRLEEYRDEHMRRTMRMARLLDLSPGSKERMDLIQPLCDAAVISIADDKLTISGIERYEVFASVMQTWFVEVMALQE